MPLERFLQMLYTMQNVLVHPSAWDDPYEKLVQKSAACVKREEKIEYLYFNDKLWYGQCWSFSKENDSLWHVFSKGRISRSVKIKTTSEALKATLNSLNPKLHFFFEKVQYAAHAKGEKNIKKEIASTIHFERMWGEGSLYEFVLNEGCFKDDVQVKAAPLLLTKRKPFESEHEVRLILYSKEELEDDVFSYDIPKIGDFIKEVELDPWTPKGVDDAVRDIVGHYIPGVNIPVYTSDLYKPIERGLLYDPDKLYNNNQQQ